MLAWGGWRHYCPAKAMSDTAQTGSGANEEARAESDAPKKKAKIDYAWGYALFAQNYRSKEIALRLGCSEVALRKMMSRQGWPEKRDRAMRAAVEDSKKLSLERQSEIFREVVGDDLLQTARQLPE